MKQKKYFNYNFLISLRRRAGETQTDVANAVGVSLTTVANWENGHKSASTKNLQAIACHFRVDWTLFVSKAEQVAWQNYQHQIMLGEVDHDQAMRDAINLNALPLWQTPDEEISEAQQDDDDLLDESEAPKIG